MDNEIFLSDDNFREEFATVVRPFLNAIHSKVVVKRPDGMLISGHYYRCEGSGSVIFISHGYTEFAERYLEMTYYFVKMGYSVAICEHRGHGYSGRTLVNPCMVHVDSYDEYVKDYKAFVDKVNSCYPNAHKYLFGHSMGGCIASLYIEKYTDDFEKCVLSAPMHEPDRGGYPKFLAEGICLLLILAGKGQHYLWDKDHDYRPIETFEKSCCMEINRWTEFNDMRVATEAYHTSEGSVKWRYESMKAADKSVRDAGKIRIPVLLFQAELDNMVTPDGHAAFMKRCADVKKVFMAGEKHESFNSCLESRKKFYGSISDFLIK